MVKWCVLLAVMAIPAHAEGLQGPEAAVVGNRTLEVSKTIQLTTSAEGDAWLAQLSPDGRTAAYVAGTYRTANLSVVKTNGLSKPVPVVKGVPDPYGTFDYEVPPKGEVVAPEYRISWSPDSRFFTMAFRRYTWEGESHRDYPYVVVYTSDGAQQAAVGLPEIGNPPEGLVFSPDSKRLAISYTVNDDGKSGDTGQSQKLMVLDVMLNTTRDVPWTAKTNCVLIGWTGDGTGLICETWQSGVKYVKVGLDGRMEEVERPASVDPNLSPDGQYRIEEPHRGDVVPRIDDQSTGDQFKPEPPPQMKSTIVNTRSGKAVFAFDSPPFHCRKSCANSKAFIYSLGRQTVKTPTADGEHVESFEPLWLGNLETGALKSIRVTLDGHSPSVSNDGSRVLYATRGGSASSLLWVAEIGKREPTFEEKITLGLPLDEEDEKTAVVMSARTINGVFEGRFGETDSKPLPDEAEFRKLFPEQGYENPLVKPGTQQDMFHYLGGGLKITDIADRWATPLVELDAGYDWKTIIYADFHIRTIKKK